MEYTPDDPNADVGSEWRPISWWSLPLQALHPRHRPRGPPVAGARRVRAARLPMSCRFMRHDPSVADSARRRSASGTDGRGSLPRRSSRSAPCVRPVPAPAFPCARDTRVRSGQILWTVPIYVVSLVLNTIWCQDIADQSAPARARSPTPLAPSPRPSTPFPCTTQRTP